MSRGIGKFFSWKLGIQSDVTSERWPVHVTYSASKSDQMNQLLGVSRELTDVLVATDSLIAL
jgi:hypothetical protein